VDDRHVTTLTATKRSAASGEVPGVQVMLQRDPAYAPVCAADESALMS
jgi:hypothetical protein